MKKKRKKTSMYNNEELEIFFLKIFAPFWKRFFSTFFDLCFLVLISFLVGFICFYAKFEKNIFLEIFDKSNFKKEIKATKCLIFGIVLFFIFYIYFVIIPSFTEYQTIFSYFFGIKAVSLKKDSNISEKVSQKQLFLSNLVPVFSVIIMNIFLFILMSSIKNTGWTSFFKKDSKDALTDWEKVFVVSSRMIISSIFLVQMYYFFAIALSKKLNWFSKSVGLIYIDIKKYQFFTDRKLEPVIFKKQEEVQENFDESNNLDR